MRIHNNSVQCGCLSSILKVKFCYNQWRVQDLFQQGQKKNSGGAEARSFFLPPPLAEFDSAPWVEKTRKGAENLIIPRERGRNNLTI